MAAKRRDPAEQCMGTKRDGNRCDARRKPGSDYCGRHGADAKKLGRPPILARIVDADNGLRVFDVIIESLKAGAPKRFAAQAAGISETALFDSVARGVEWTEDPESAPEDKRIYAEFAAAVEKAIGQGVVINLAEIRKAAKRGSWQAAAWLLERRFPKDFGRRTQIEPVNADGETLTFAELMDSAGKEK